jgi:hypothetical protein
MNRMEAEKTLAAQVGDELSRRSIISFRTYFLSDYGELALKVIVRSILEKLGRSDLMDVVYTTAKELIINATKANFKRVLFNEMGIDFMDDALYEHGMGVFRQKLQEAEIKRYEDEFRRQNFPVITTFYFSPEVLNIKVKNLFTLMPAEEKSIRYRFEKARSFANLFDFYTEYGDDTEGAGLGLAMVGILLDETGIDRHAFTLYSTEFNETAARLELPLSDGYVSKREMFEQQRSAAGVSAEEFRSMYNRSVFESY